MGKMNFYHTCKHITKQPMKIKHNFDKEMELLS
jgi:hypothetical protein